MNYSIERGDNMSRYSRILNKHPREIVLLKAFPCIWGKCSFCDYILDNELDRQTIIDFNHDILSNITGELKTLEVINSGSVFELPDETLKEIRQIVNEKEIETLFFEAHWIYRHQLDEIRNFFKIPIIFKTGIETFDNEFREKVLNKAAPFTTPEEVAKYFDSPCLMVGIKGQTKEMIAKDMEILTKYFDYGTINIYTNNSTSIKRDSNLVDWFIDTYNNLFNDPRYEILYNPEDFGVGDGRKRK